MNRLERWSQQRFLRKQRIPLRLWKTVLVQAPALRQLDVGERVRLRALSSRFLRDKRIVGARGLAVTAEMRAAIAAQACLPILNLGLDYYRGWREVIVYPDTFVVEHEEHDEAGVVHRTRRALDGEAWERGPVVLSWRDARPGAQPYGPGSNVVLHEFAHKLDMLDGSANGMPPLHADMSRPAWTEVLASAYDDLNLRLDRDDHTAIDPYAAENPAEFFAVLTELFFELPQLLYESYPKVYAAFEQFYRQDTLSRFRRSA